MGRYAELGRRWEERRDQLEELVRLRRHEAVRPPDPPREQKIRMRLTGGRTGVRALTCAGLALHGLTEPFDLEVFYGERVAVLGATERESPPRGGAAYSIQMRLPAGRPKPDAVAHEGAWKLGARVVPGHFSQTHDRPELAGRTLLDILWKDCALRPEEAARVLNRYELTPAREQRFDTLSGGQHARLQILLLELSGATMLLPSRSAARKKPPVGDLTEADRGETEHGRPRKWVRRAHGQPRRRLGGGAGGRAGRIRGHRARSHPRPVVHSLVRPVRVVHW